MKLGLIDPAVRKGPEFNVDLETGSAGRLEPSDWFAPGVILHPTDYTEGSQWTFELACRLARFSGGRVIVFHVAPPRRISPLGMAGSPTPRGDRGAWEERLRRMHPPHDGARIEHRLAEGHAAEEIVRVAREQQCDLILMAGHAPGQELRLRRGTDPEVCRTAPCPVAVLTASSRARPLFFDSEGSGARRLRVPTVSEEMMPRLHSILHPTDFSREANLAFDLARCLAQDAGGELEVVHAAPRPLFYGYRGYREKIERNLRRMAQCDPSLRVWSHVSAGDPVEETVWLARGGLCDLIVLGQHGRRGWKRLWHGSVSREIQRRVDCPVLTVAVPRAVAGQKPVPGDAAGHAHARNSPAPLEPVLQETGGRS